MTKQKSNINNNPSVRRNPAGGRTSNKPVVQRQQQQRSMSSSAAAVSYSLGLNSSKPHFSQTNEGVRIAHREYVTDVSYATTALFTISDTLSINPGLGSCGAWLALIAANFEVYQFHKLRFIYQATEPTSTKGGLFMAIDYDAADGPPTTKPQMMSNASTSTGSIWSSQVLEVNCNMFNMLLNKFTRNVSVTGDIKTYDMGNLYIAQESAATGSPGNLFVEYDISLRIPQIPTNSAFADSEKLTFSQTTTLSAVGDTISGNALIAQPLAGSTSIGAWHFSKPGQYLLSYAISATAAADNAPIWSVFSGAGTVLDAGYSALDSATDTGIYEAILNVVDPGLVVRIALTAITLVTNYNLRIAKYGYLNG